MQHELEDVLLGGFALQELGRDAQATLFVDGLGMGVQRSPIYFFGGALRIHLHLLLLVVNRGSEMPIGVVKTPMELLHLILGHVEQVTELGALIELVVGVLDGLLKPCLEVADFSFLD